MEAAKNNTEEHLVDTAQEALIKAENELSETIEQVLPASNDHHVEAFYLHAEFWVAVSFVCVVFLLFRPIVKIGKSLLLKRIEGIKNKLNDAANLKTEAQKILAEYEKKLLQANMEAKEILNKSEKQIALLRQEGLDKLAAAAKIKEEDAKNRIASIKVKASKEIIETASLLSIRAVKEALAQNSDKKNLSILIDDSINSLKKL